MTNSGNPSLGTDATIYYYCDSAPEDTSDGNSYWHYVDGAATVWE